MSFFAPFCIPFLIGVAVLFLSLAIKYTLWIRRLPATDRMLIVRYLPTRATLEGIWEVICESLLHRRIFRVNPMLGYMHMSLAFGWFLLIAVGWMETIALLGFRLVPLQGHVFFKYFAALQPIGHAPIFDFLMDLLLLIVLSGVALAWTKRFYARLMGMRRTTRHTIGDRIALSALWFIFPARLAAECVTAALYGGGGFLTGNIGSLLGDHVSIHLLLGLFQPLWWFYSLALGTFFCALPYSRYMHIFTEIPLIFLRRYGVKSRSEKSSFDHFQIEACSRCGICIDPCQLQSELGINDVQSVYFLRDRRSNRLSLKIAENCLMCGRCAERCPVGIDLMTLRLNSRHTMRNSVDERRYRYLKGIDRSQGEGKVGYFAGCMTLLTPRTLQAMEQIFAAAGEQVWWADRSGGVCCGRPLRLSGEVSASKRMVESNRELFYKHGITTLVTSCPICLRTFREEYNLRGIEVLHHSQYILRLIEQGRLQLRGSTERFTYHDPCELGRGCGIYDEPRALVRAMGTLLEPEQTRENALCCGSSLANNVIGDREQLKLAHATSHALAQTGADRILTACPQCKKAIARGQERTPVADLSEVVAEQISTTNTNN